LNPASEKIMESGHWIFQRKNDTYGVFWPDTKKYGPNDLPLMKALHGENVDDVEYLSKITKTRYFCNNAEPLKDKTGKITEVAVFHDITERKKSENLIKTLMKT
jgi:hypothetical protein